MINENELRKKFEQIIEQHKGILYKVARTYCQNDDDRQDLVQEIMIQIWKSLHTYNNSFALTTWLFRISLNVAISFYRKNEHRKKNTIPLPEELEIMYVEESNEKQEMLSLLDMFISELNHIDKALILLYLEEKSYAEIAEIMAISITNVGTKLGRIKEKLKSKYLKLHL